MDIDRRHDGIDLCGDAPLWLGSEMIGAADIGESIRIGITKEVERKLRYFERDNPHVSGPKHLNA